MPKIRHSGPRHLRLGVDVRPPRESATAAARDLGQCVYAVRVKPDLIKIGCTSDLDRRIRKLGAKWADVLLALPGGYEDEAVLHVRFHEHLAHGREYYHPHPEIHDWINGERKRLGIMAAI